MTLSDRPAPDLDALLPYLEGLEIGLTQQDEKSAALRVRQAIDAITSLRERVTAAEAERDNWKQQAELNRLAIYEEVLKKNRAVFDVEDELGRKLETAKARVAELEAALRPVLYMAEEWFRHGGDETTDAAEYKTDIDRARAALAKAEGR